LRIFGRTHFVGDFLGLDRIGGLCGERDDLNGGVAVERVGFRLEILGADLSTTALASGRLRGSGP